MPPGLRRRSRKSNNDDPTSTTSIDGSITIASTTDDSNMKPQLKEKENHPLLRSRTSMKHLTLKRLKSNPTKPITTTTTHTTAKTSLSSSSFSSSPLDTTQLEIIMHNDASEDFNDLKSLLTENDSTHYNHDHNNNNKSNNNNNTNNNHVSTTPSKKEDESKIKRMTTRLISGWLMVGTFVGTMYLGHIYMCTLIFLVEVALVRFSLLL
jgi:hypothetical protein